VPVQAVVAAGAEAAAVSTPAASAEIETRCRRVAEQRKTDGAANGYDSATQDEIFTGTLKSCMDWAAQHP